MPNQVAVQGAPLNKTGRGVGKTLIHRTLLWGLVASIVLLILAAAHVTPPFRNPRSSPFAVLALVGLVAIGIPRIKAQARALSSRIVYGHRRTPYEILADFSNQASFGSLESVLPEMAQMLAHGTGAATAAVWLRSGSRLVCRSAWPPNSGNSSIEMEAGKPSEFPGVSFSAPVRQEGEIIGALTINKRAGASVIPLEQGLVEDLARQAGPLFANTQIKAELSEQLDEARRQSKAISHSKRRIVEIHDARRRSLERDLHDGAQQYLVALTLTLRRALIAVGKTSKGAPDLVSQSRDLVKSAIQALGGLSAGDLESQIREVGLEAALRKQVETLPVVVEIELPSLRRYRPELESALYFICTEAVQNAVKHAHPSAVKVSIREQKDELLFSVTDDGMGFELRRTEKQSGLRNMRERASALGGNLEIASTPGGGCSVSGRVPLSEP